MEDKQPATGDLTDEAPAESEEGPQADTVLADTVLADAVLADAVAAAPTDETGADEPETAASDESDSAEAEDEAEAATAADDTATEPPAKKAKKARKGRVAAVLVAVAAALFVGSAAFAGAAVQPYLVERATVDVKQNVARAAANAITTLWSYTPENMDTLANRAGHYLTGDFGAQYRKFVEESVVAPNKQYKVTTSTEVTGVAVENLNGTNATVIVYTNTTTTTPLKKNIPSMQYLSYLLTMKREGDRWLVSRMNTITSLDVTAQL